jgi:hypothetical protein
MRKLIRQVDVKMTENRGLTFAAAYGIFVLSVIACTSIILL